MIERVQARAFVVMPFGTKRAATTGTEVDFDQVYEQLLRPAIEAAGLSPSLAGADWSGSSIHVDLFQELLLAEVVLADITLDNANVFYELGIRHALRPRGMVLSKGLLKEPGDPLPLVLKDQRVQHYTLIGGRLDGSKLEEERNALTEAIRAALDAWHNREASSVFTLLPPTDWKSLKAGDLNELRQVLEAWRGCVRGVGVEDK